MAPLKWIVRAAGVFLALPYFVLYTLARPVLGRDRALSASSEAVSLLPGLIGLHVRHAFYRWTLRRVGADVHFGFLSLLSKAEAQIGDRVYIGRMCTIGWAEIGPDALLADGVQILSGRRQHGQAEAGRTMRDAPQTFNRVSIGAGAWIGAGAVVMADIGAHARIAAGAVVVEAVEAGATVGGVPAKPLRHG